MVVPASDSLTVDDGFAFDASDAIPELDDAAIPMDEDDAALLETAAEDGAASPETEPFSVESLSLPPDQLEAFRQHIAAELTPQLEATFAEERSQWERVRQSLEGAAENHKSQRLTASAEARALRIALNHLMQEAGYDQNYADAVNYRVERTRDGLLNQYHQKVREHQAQTEQVQQAQTELQATFQSEIDRVRTLMHAHAQSVGLDPTHATVNQEFDDLVVAAAEAYFDDPGNPKLKKAFENAKAMHKKRVTELGEMTKRRKAARPAAEATARQRARGPQNLSRGGNGAAPMSLTQHIEAVRAEATQHGQNLPYREIHQIATQRYYQQQQH